MRLQARLESVHNAPCGLFGEIGGARDELAKALGAHGIRVNALSPGAIAAGGFKPATGMAASIPLGRLGTTDDIASMGVALLSNKYAGYVTAADIVADGGISLHNWFAPAVP